MKFKEFVANLFEDTVEIEMSEETPEVIEVAPVDEVDEVIEEVIDEPVYMLKEDVEALIAATVEQTVSQINLAKEEVSTKAVESNKELVDRLIKLEVELQAPAKKAEKVIPTVKETKEAYWSMANAVK